MVIIKICSQERACAHCSEAWLALLRLPLPERLFQELLPEVTTKVLKHIKNPLVLSDFFTKAVEHGGLIGILALQGLFYLVTEHGLEHPEFYQRLYGLLQPQVLPSAVIVLGFFHDCHPRSLQPRQL
jgi:U3 small nucleolar RNA-associated protein 19